MTKPETASRSIGTAAPIIEREMPRPPEKVWRALTQDPLIEEWLMQNDFEPVVGRGFNFHATPMSHWKRECDRVHIGSRHHCLR